MADELKSEVEWLQNIISKFPSGIYLVFAYGSGVFKQEGNVSSENMIDFVFVVEDSREWHSENIFLHPSHYSFIGHLGTNTVVAVQDDFGAGVYYNTLVPFHGRLIKYGVVNRENFERDMCSWEWLYISGRLHKPVQIVHRKQGSSIATILHDNLTHAVNTALLCLPETFSEQDLYTTISWLSYAGDFRMIIGEDKGKVKKIVHSNMQGFHDLYQKLISNRNDMTILPSGLCQQDLSLDSTHSLLTNLPSALLRRVVRYAKNDNKTTGRDDVLHEVAQDRSKCDAYVCQSVASIVLKSSMTQSAKGILTAGLLKTLTYSSMKIRKMLRGMVK